MGKKVVREEMGEEWVGVVEKECERMEGVCGEKVGVGVVEKEGEWKGKKVGECEGGGWVKGCVGKWEGVVMEMGKGVGGVKMGMELLGVEGVCGGEGEMLGVGGGEGI